MYYLFHEILYLEDKNYKAFNIMQGCNEVLHIYRSSQGQIQEKWSP